MSLYRRGKSYVYDFWYRQQRYRGNFGPVSKTTALALERKRKVEVAEARVAPVIVHAMTLGSFASPFMAWYDSTHRPQSTIRIQTAVSTLVTSLGSVLMDDISVAHMDAYRRTRLQAGRAVRTVNHEMVALGQMLRMAETLGLSAPHDRRLKLLRVDESEIRILSADEERRLLAECHPRLRAVVRLGLQTGLRRQELVELIWTDVLWERGTIRVRSPVAKSGKSREVPMSLTARGILLKLWTCTTDDHGSVFGYRDFATPFRDAARRAGLEWVHIHTMRHTFATRAMERHVHPRVVQRWLGHASLKQTERYMHPTLDHEREAILVMDAPQESPHSPRRPPTPWR